MLVNSTMQQSLCPDQLHPQPPSSSVLYEHLQPHQRVDTRGFCACRSPSVSRQTQEGKHDPPIPGWARTRRSPVVSERRWGRSGQGHDPDTVKNFPPIMYMSLLVGIYGQESQAVTGSRGCSHSLLTCRICGCCMNMAYTSLYSLAVEFSPAP